MLSLANWRPLLLLDSLFYDTILYYITIECPIKQFLKYFQFLLSDMKKVCLTKHVLLIVCVYQQSIPLNCLSNRIFIHIKEQLNAVICYLTQCTTVTIYLHWQTNHVYISKQSIVTGFCTAIQWNKCDFSSCGSWNRVDTKTERRSCVGKTKLHARRTLLLTFLYWMKAKVYSKVVIFVTVCAFSDVAEGVWKLLHLVT